MAKVLGVVSTPYHLLVFLFVMDAFCPRMRWI